MIWNLVHRQTFQSMEAAFTTKVCHHIEVQPHREPMSDTGFRVKRPKPFSSSQTQAHRSFKDSIQLRLIASRSRPRGKSRDKNKSGKDPKQVPVVSIIRSYHSLQQIRREVYQSFQFCSASSLLCYGERNFTSGLSQVRVHSSWGSNWGSGV